MARNFIRRRPYFTLVSALGSAPWCIEFGAYDRADVVLEMSDRRYEDRMSTPRGMPRPAYRILRHDARQQSATVDALNAAEARTWTEARAVAVAPAHVVAGLLGGSL